MAEYADALLVIHSDTKGSLGMKELMLKNKKPVTDKHIKNLKKIRQNMALSDPKYLAIVKFIVNNPDMSYAERGRVIGRDTSTTRKISLKYSYLKE